METDSVSFCAIPISRVKIKKYNKFTRQFADYFANFVKIDACNKKDLNAIYKTAQKWKKWEEAKYIQQISTSCQWMKQKSIDVYVLTSQKNNLEKLNADNILGLAEIRADNDDASSSVLRYLQVRPTAMNVNQKNKVNYKYVGSAILKSLQKIYKKISLQADKNKKIEQFYKKNGFINDFDGSSYFRWSSNPLKRLMLRFEKFRRELGI